MLSHKRFIKTACRSGITLLPLLFLWFSVPVFAQNEPDSQVLKDLSFLDRTGIAGSYDTYPETEKNRVLFAIRLCRQNIQKNPDSLSRSMFYYHKGRLEALRGNRDTAFNDYREALHLNISNYPALQEFCALCAQKHPEFEQLWAYINGAINLWKIKCSLDSSQAFQWYYLAKTYELQTKHMRMIKQYEISECYERCIALEPDNHFYYFEYALQSQGKRKTELLKKALSLQEEPAYRLSLGQHYLALKQYRELHTLLDTGIRLYAAIDPVPHALMAEFYRLKAEAFNRQKHTAAAQSCRSKWQYHTGQAGSKTH